MLGPSFLSNPTARLLPGRRHGKQAVVALAVAALAGCGGASEKRETTKRVHAGGYSFLAPSGWKRERKGRTLNVASGDDVLSVTTFTLAKAAHPRAAELDRTARELARVLGGSVRGSRLDRVGGKPVRVYRLEYGERGAEVAFAFRGRAEWELFCQYRGDRAPRRCAEFRGSFRPE